MAEFNDFSQQNPRQTQHTIGPTGIQTRQIADLAVTNAKISSLTFDKAVGGTLTLGGLNNVSGQFSLKNSSGTEVVHMDNTGIQVNSGNIIIKDSTNTSILDATGLISTANFLKATTTHGVDQTFTTTLYVDLTSSAFPSFTLTRSTTMMFIVHTFMYLVESAGNTGDAVMFIDIDGAITNAGGIFLHSGNTAGRSYDLVYITTLSAGAHIVKLKARFEGITAGAPVLHVGEFYFTRMQMGS